MVVAPGAFLPPAGFETLARAVQVGAWGYKGLALDTCPLYVTHTLRCCEGYSMLNA